MTKKQILRLHDLTATALRLWRLLAVDGIQIGELQVFNSQGIKISHSLSMETIRPSLLAELSAIADEIKIELRKIDSGE